jgi:uncharacterized membrane protein YhaH (DUF805 family)
MSNLMSILAQSNNGSGVAGAIGTLIFFVIWLAIIVLIIAGIWKTFVKAGQPGWAAIVPIYNIYILTKIVGRPAWWTVLFFIPLIGLIPAIIVSLDVAKAFGKSTAFAIGLILLSPIFFCILGFGDAQYQGPVAANKAFV